LRSLASGGTSSATIAIPATVAASGYIQAWSKSCAAFGSRAVFYFGRVGEVEPVADAEARRRDRAKATRLGLASVAVGASVGVAWALLPV
jgi:hypothetical protein